VFLPGAPAPEKLHREAGQKGRTVGERQKNSTEKPDKRAGQSGSDRKTGGLTARAGLPFWQLRLVAERRKQ
jgi:hypothetical protein